MLLARLIRRLGRTGWIDAHLARRIATWVEHLEHAGGGVVGIEFLMPHTFSGLGLGVIAAVVVAVRVLATLSAEDGLA